MGKLEEFFIHLSIENLIAVQLGDKGLEEGEEGCSTPKNKLIFDLLGGSERHQVSDHFRKSNSLDPFWVTQGTWGRAIKCVKVPVACLMQTFWTSTPQDLSNDTKNAQMQGDLTPAIEL
jgi:hypothetical protein